VTHDTELLGDDWTTWWGDGVEFSAQSIAPDRVSWHCLVPHDGRASMTDDLNHVQQLVATWPNAVRAVVSLTAAENIFRHDISIVHGEMRSFSAGRTVLVGDAAHPLLPTISQGANLGLEDGATLGELLHSRVELHQGLRRFDELRLARSRRVARAAKRMARIGAGCPIGLEQVLRDAILRRLPPRSSTRFLDAITDWRTPGQE
jgi:2-polyprenyl-6-methoxyphenol hydroxylase-like FAD-dependent oxidoreductase